MCAYCRGAIDRSEVARCASRTCGALYHADCWLNCAADTGKCAIMGCGWTRALGVDDAVAPPPPPPPRMRFERPEPDGTDCVALFVALTGMVALVPLYFLCPIPEVSYGVIATCVLALGRLCVPMRRTFVQVDA